MKPYLFVLFSACIFSLALNFANLCFIKNHEHEPNVNARSLVDNSTIYNIDNNWYLPQAENYLQSGRLWLDTTNRYSAVRRTPGYSIFYLSHLFLFGEKRAHYYIRFTQVAFFGLSAFFLALTVLNITGSKKIALTSGFLYSFNPFIASWNFYTITEAIHPAFVVFALYLFSVTIKKRQHYLFVGTGVLVAAATLIRPTNGLLLPAMMFALVFLNKNDNFWDRVKKASFYSVFVLFGFSILIGTWTIRNYLITKDIVPLEKFYHEDVMGFGKGEKYMMKWLSAWGNNSQTLLINSLNADTTNNKNVIEAMVNQFPSEAFQGYGKEEVIAAFASFKNCMTWKKKQGVWMKIYTPAENVPGCELDAVNQFSVLTTKFKNAAPLRYYLVTPLKKTKEFILHSFSGQLALLNAYDNQLSWWQVLFKGFMYLFNLVSWSSLIILFLPGRMPISWRVLIGVFVLGTVFTFVSLATVEVRYALACYPFLIIVTGVFSSPALKFKTRLD